MKPLLEDLKKYKDYDIVPIYEELLSDFTTPLNVLRNIKEISNQFYLLESVDPSKFSRYSYLGYNPVHKIVCKDNIVKYLCKEDLQAAIKCLEEALKAYPGRTR